MFERKGKKKQSESLQDDKPLLSPGAAAAPLRVSAVLRRSATMKTISQDTFPPRLPSHHISTRLPVSGALDCCPRGPETHARA